MAIQKTSAIVLKTQPFRSSSLIVTFYTKDFGKVRGLAKGVRQERELRGALFELFTQLEIVYYEKTRSDLHLISEGMITDSYDRMRGRLEALAYASYFAELVDKTTEVHDPNENIFALLDFFMRYLASLPGARLARLFEIKLLNEIGWLPHLADCLSCGMSGIEAGFFSSRQGGLVCAKCLTGYPEARPLAAETLSVMRYYITHGLEECIRVAMTRQTEAALEVLMESFLSERLGQLLKSQIFLSKIGLT